MTLKSGSWLPAMLLFLAFIGPAVGEEKTLRFPPERVISMKISEYRRYLLAHPPLDRLARLGDTYYFLRDDSVCTAPEDRLPEAGRLVSAVPSVAATDEGDVNGMYHSSQEMEARLRELASLYPELTLVFSIGQCIEGRELLVMKISDHPQIDEGIEEPNLYIVGCHHAREWISVEIPLCFIRYLLENYRNDPAVRRAVDGTQIFVQPIQNPDGLEFSIHTYRYWRKNRRHNGNLSWGVDTNRNYGFAWGYDDVGSSPDPDSGVYRGEYPFSEPECTAVRDFLLSHPPSGSLSYHNYSQAIIYPWSYNRQPTADDQEMGRIAEEMSERIFRVHGRRYTHGIDPLGYPANGGTGDWIYATFGAPSFTIELPPEYSVFGGFFTDEAMIQSAFTENIPALLYFVNYFVRE